VSRTAVLVVDDERDLAESTAYFLERAGFAAECATSAAEALAAMQRQPFAVVVTDVRMPRMSGAELLTAIKQRDPDVEVLLMTGHPDLQGAVAAIKQGAFDYLAKPFGEKELVERVTKAAAHRQVRERNEGLRERLRSGKAGLQLVHASPAFGAALDMLERAARTDASVLLFGHKKGAFTGAIADKLGLFQVADGGTLFLDELGELPAAFQGKLLRAIQERAVRPVGGHEQVAVDVRIVAATNRNLQKEVDEGRFRADLFYRLDVVRIAVPPLRERPEDVEVLARHFVGKFGAKVGVTGLSAATLAALRAFHWPGNVRQLRNAIERACALGQRGELQLADLPPELREQPAGVAVDDGESIGGTFQEMKARHVAALESAYLEALLKKHKGNVTHCSEEAGMTRSAFQKLMQKHGIRSSGFRDG
jgi:DNA-binding NtrC family response regulator